MSDTEQAKSLDDISREFNQTVGHFPHTVQQLLSYCKQKSYPYKFTEINKWWPSREMKEEKKKIKPVNADEYKDENNAKDKTTTTTEKSGSEANGSTQQPEANNPSTEHASEATDKNEEEEEEEENEDAEQEA